MHPALWKLYRFQTRGRVRKAFGRLKTVRGALLFVFTLIVLGMIFVPNLLMFVAGNDMPGGGEPTHRVLRELFPIVLLGFCGLSLLTSAGERAIYFSPSDIDWLFAAPVTRRELLLYKITSGVISKIALGALYATAFIRFLPTWSGGYVGLVLSLLFIDGIAMCAQLAGQIVSMRAYTATRKAALAAVAVGVVIGLARFEMGAVRGSWLDALTAFRSSPVGQVVLAPFEVFARVATSSQWTAGIVGWAMIGVAINAVIYGVAIALDANFLETAVRVSERLQKARKRRVRGAIVGPSRSPRRAGPHKRTPWLGGSGPIAWRQTKEIVRRRRQFLLFAVVPAVGVALFAFFSSSRSIQNSELLPLHVAIGIAYVTLILSSNVPLGFKGDLDCMDHLKSLPIHPLPLAAGQLVVVTATVTFAQWLIAGAAAAAYPREFVPLAVVACFAVQFNLILFGLENALFLVYPYRLHGRASDGLLNMGKVMLFMLAKMLWIAISAGLAAIPAGVAYLVVGNSIVVWAIAWCALLLPSAATVGLVAWAFARYDVSLGADD